MTLLALTVLASDESKKSGPIGLAVILVLCVVCYFLFKSMSRHLRKVREDFGGETPPSTPVEPSTASDTEVSAPPTDSPTEPHP